ncbi:MAG: Gfo/Idh/MocA family oxidoreductase [Planctomycetota bacterium]
MEQVRLGLIGCGSMGSHHAKYFSEVDGLTFAAVCDHKPAAADEAARGYDDCRRFDTAEALISSGEVDAVLIATPHYDHPAYARLAFEHGVHVLVEKPVAVTAKIAAETNTAYETALKKHPKLVYAAMFNQRTRPQWQQIKKMMDNGTVGELIRVEWVITNWFRSQTYYNSGGWRATWRGEGGGVLLNQCPHNLDLFQWFVGMPSRLWTIAGVGKFHDIEVEDDITTMMTFANGATGTFITSTGQTPGINRLTIVGSNGTLEAPDTGDIVFREASQDIREFTMSSPDRFGDVAVTEHRIKAPDQRVPQHQSITVNFVNYLLGKDDTLMAPAVEGINGLELGNAMLYSGLNDSAPVDLPMDREAFAAKLDELIANSTFQKKVDASAGAAAMGGSF